MRPERDVKLYRSRYVHLLPMAPDRLVVVHALDPEQRVPLSAASARLLNVFDGGAEIGDVLPGLLSELALDGETVLGAIAAFVERGLLTRADPTEEEAAACRELHPLLGRDPSLAPRARGAMDYWTVQFTRRPADLVPRAKVRLLLIGECDVHVEADFLEQEARRHGLDLTVATTMPDVLSAIRDVSHDAILVGALSSRHSIALGSAEDHGGDPAGFYIAEAERLIRDVRAITSAPILLDGLPLPTVQPLGYADRGRYSHRNRFRLANLALADLVERHADIHLVDCDAVLGAAGTVGLLDDGLVHYTHFGSRGWMLQRPPSERAAVHNCMPPLDRLSDRLGADPYRRERIMACEHVSLLRSILAIDRIKCLVVDLDGVLWPGVLAETGAPFAWQPDISSPYSFVGVYFGIHEALKSLMRRGILLACASRNDHDVVLRLWRYGPNDPVDRLILPEDFVAMRINWGRKSDSVREIADDLGIAIEAIGFIDDSQVERAEMATELPKVAVFGDDLFRLREDLLTDSRLSPSALSTTAIDRSRLVRQRLNRESLRSGASDETAFRASLEIVLHIRRTDEPEALARAAELFGRTTQFNATGACFTSAELAAIISRPDRNVVIVLDYQDRFGDQGLVGAAVIMDDEIRNIAISCRVLGLGIEQRFLEWIVSETKTGTNDLRGRIIPTDRNLAVRNLYADAGFIWESDGTWKRNGSP